MLLPKLALSATFYMHLNPVDNPSTGYPKRATQTDQKDGNKNAH